MQLELEERCQTCESLQALAFELASGSAVITNAGSVVEARIERVAREITCEREQYVRAPCDNKQSLFERISSRGAASRTKAIAACRKTVSDFEARL